MTHSPVLTLPYLAPAQGLKYITHNEAVESLDRVVQMRIASFSRSIPPDEADRQDNALYWTGPDPRGEWVGHKNQLTYHINGAWKFFAAQLGFMAVHVPSLDIYSFDGAAWIPLETPPLTEYDKLGIGTRADDTNRLSVASEATLFTHDGANHRLIINRQSTFDTAALIFQTDFSGGAEIGLAGTQNLQIKFSPDGQSFIPALSMSTQSGDIELGQKDQHTRFSVNGSAVIAKHFRFGEVATPTVTDTLASGFEGASYTLSRRYTYGSIGWQGNISSAYRARGVDENAASVVSGDIIQTFNAYAHDGNSFRLAARLSVQAEGAPENGYAGCKVVFDLSDGKTYPVFGGQGRVLEIRSDKSVRLNGPVLLSDVLQLAPVAAVNLPVANVAGHLVFVSNAEGGGQPAYSDGSEWRSLIDGSVIST